MEFLINKLKHVKIHKSNVYIPDMRLNLCNFDDFSNIKDIASIYHQSNHIKKKNKDSTFSFMTCIVKITMRSAVLSSEEYTRQYTESYVKKYSELIRQDAKSIAHGYIDRDDIYTMTVANPTKMLRDTNLHNAIIKYIATSIQYNIFIRHGDTYTPVYTMIYNDNIAKTRSVLILKNEKIGEYDVCYEAGNSQSTIQKWLRINNCKIESNLNKIKIQELCDIMQMCGMNTLQNMTARKLISFYGGKMHSIETIKNMSK